VCPVTLTLLPVPFSLPLFPFLFLFRSLRLRPFAFYLHLFLSLFHIPTKTLSYSHFLLIHTTIPYLKVIPLFFPSLFFCCFVFISVCFCFDDRGRHHLERWPDVAVHTLCSMFVPSLSNHHRVCLHQQQQQQ
jgi:hypothetical protein